MFNTLLTANRIEPTRSATAQRTVILVAMNRKAGVPALALLVFAAIVAACGGGDSGTKTTIRTIPARAPVATTGVPELDQIVGGATSVDTIELAGLTGYQKISCKKSIPNPAPNDPPLCRENEPDGAQVEVLASAKCAGEWVRPEQVPDAFKAALGDGTPKFVAAYRPKPTFSTFGGGLGAQQVVVFETGSRPGGGQSGAALYIKDGRVVIVATECANFADLIAPQNVASFIIDPKGVTPSAAATEPPPPPADTPAP